MIFCNKKWRAECIFLILLVLIGAGCTRNKNGESDGITTTTTLPIFLTGITLAAPSGSLVMGSVMEMSAQGKFSNQTIQILRTNLIWTTTDATIASVDNKGRVTGNRVGRTTITVTSGLFSASKDIDVVLLALQTVTLNSEDTSIFVDMQKSFTAVGSFNNGTRRDLTSLEVVWSSSDTGIASVNDTGKVTGLAAGMLTLKAKTVPDLGSIEGTTTLQVKLPILTRISVTPLSATMATGTQQQFKATGTYNSGVTKDITASVTWGTNNGLVTMSQEMATAGNATGTTQISATLGDRTGLASLTVVEATLQSVVVTPHNPTMAIGTTKLFEAFAVFDNNTQQNVTNQAVWSGSPSGIATVGNTGGDKGKVAVLQSGTATISASFGGQSGQVDLTVINGTLQTVSVAPVSSAIAKGTTQQFQAIGTYSNGGAGFNMDVTSSATWTSLASSTASIDSQGLATGNSVGTTTIMASFEGKSTTTSLTITNAILQSIIINALPNTPNPFVYLGGDLKFQAVGIFNDNTTQDVSPLVIWSSDSTSRAIIQPSQDKSVGIATGLSEGSVVIQARIGTITGTTTLTVKGQTLLSLKIQAENGAVNPQIPKGAKLNLEVIGTYNDGSELDMTDEVDWSWNANFFSIDTSNGTVLGLKAGTSTIQVSKSLGGVSVSATLKVTVTDATLLGIDVTSESNSIPVGMFLPFLATARFSDGSTGDVTALAVWGVTSASGGPVVATIDNSVKKGLVKAEAVGSAQITATYLGGTGTTTLTINLETLISISVTPASSQMGVGLTQQYIATAKYTVSSYDVTPYASFQSSASTIVVVSPTGLAKGIATGSASILAQFGGKQGSTVVTVINLTLDKIDVTPAGATVPEGATLPYKATGTYQGGFTGDLTTSVIWSVRSPSMAKVGASTGLVTGISMGSTELIAAFGTISGTTTVTITGAAPKEVTAGDGHTCVTLTNRTLKCWGKNFSRQLGLSGSTDNALVATPLSGVTSATLVALGGGHTCSVLSNGTAQCWGSNQKGQLGDGTFNDASSPRNVLNLGGAKGMAVGLSHACVILDNNSVRCWGDNALGQLGDPSATSTSNVPVTVVITAIPKAITAGGTHTCLLYGTGVVDCWGGNGSGQLGNGSLVQKSSPVPVINLTGVTAIAAGGSHTCALLSAGTVTCWGDNTSGQLGGTSSGTSTTPIDVVGLSGVTGIVAGKSHTCAIANTLVKCWGANSSGQIGDNTTVARNTPVNVVGFQASDVVVDLAAGGAHTCALLQSGVTKCWGSNKYGQVGNGKSPIAKEPAPVPGISNAVGLDAGRTHSCIVLDNSPDRVIRCMGDNSYGQLGEGTTVSRDQPSSNVLGITTATSTDAGNFHSCAVLSGGTIQCWGANSLGQLGNNSNTGSSIPVTAQLLGSFPAGAVSANGDHTCAFVSGAVQCWGNNSSGELGNGTGQSSNKPVLAITSGASLSVSSGGNHTCALLSSGPGSIQCWGSNTQGQLGLGPAGTSISQLSSPGSFVLGIFNAIALAAGGAHTCTILSSDDVFCWGKNEFGQLGNGQSGSSISSAVSVVGLDGDDEPTIITAGDDHTCVLLFGGTVKCWGSNASGQLGDGNTVNSNAAVTVNLGGTATMISAGALHTCALLSDTTVKCWGSGLYGQIGEGFDMIETGPVEVVGIS